MDQVNGSIVQIQGGVVDVQFPGTNLPDLYEAIVVENDNGKTLILEVQKQLPGNSLFRP